MSRSALDLAALNLWCFNHPWHATYCAPWVNEEDYSKMRPSLPRYPAYTDSGVPWLDKVPAHWEVQRNGRLFAQRNQTGFADLPILEVSLKTGVRIRDFEKSKRKQVMADRDKYKRAAKGDLAYNMMRMWQGAIGIAPVDGLVSPAYVVARPFPETEARYFQNLFRTGAYMNEVDKYSHGIVKDRNRLYWDEFKQMPSPVPPLPEQKAIADFLDHVDRRIRRYIRAKRRLIVLLNEQKQVLIHRAVTRGLDPNVCLKPSGVEWLEEVPEHWEIKRLKWVTRLQRGYDLPQDHRQPGPVPVVSSGGIIDVHCEARAQGPGVVIGRYGSTESVFFIEESFWPHNTSLFVTDFHSNNRRWCYYLLRAISKADYASKSAVPGVDRKDLFEIRVSRPPVTEQGPIVAVLEDLLSRLDELLDQAQCEIELMREYRTRLIADVVTGKLDVREAAARLPEEPAEPEETDFSSAEEVAIEGADEAAALADATVDVNP